LAARESSPHFIFVVEHNGGVFYRARCAPSMTLVHVGRYQPIDNYQLMIDLTEANLRPKRTSGCGKSVVDCSGGGRAARLGNWQGRSLVPKTGLGK
jgi:hypothetical protein